MRVWLWDGCGLRMGVGRMGVGPEPQACLRLAGRAVKPPLPLPRMECLPALHHSPPSPPSCHPSVSKLPLLLPRLQAVSSSCSLRARLTPPCTACTGSVGEGGGWRGLMMGVTGGLEEPRWKGGAWLGLVCEAHGECRAGCDECVHHPCMCPFEVCSFASPATSLLTACSAPPVPYPAFRPAWPPLPAS